MIYAECKVVIRGHSANIDSEIILYRGDKNVDIIFTIVDSKFKFKQHDLITDMDASFGQLLILLPDNSTVSSDITPCIDGKVIFKMTESMMDEIREVGKYSFHICLFDEDQESKITLPPIYNGIEVKEPLAGNNN